MTNILVVDDSAADRVLIARLLKKHGSYTILKATDGNDAMRVLESESCDLVLTDLQMPVMDGLELVSEIKTRFPLIPTVLLTAAGSEQIAVRALQAGASSYVPKSSMISELLATIESVLSAAETDRAHHDIMERIVGSDMHICIETRMPVVQSLLRYLRQIINTTRGIPKNEHVRIGVALEEAVLNAYYHGNLEVSSKLRETNDEDYHRLAAERCELSPYSHRSLNIEIKRTVDELSVCIRDEGPGFDVSSLPDPTDPELLARPHGRGVMLMRTFLEDVRYNERGNEVTLVKRLSVAESDGDSSCHRLQ
jgi:CheY-like chemotaxis protein/anti-sigma regulatory factor (Ser/Thr protein kinase)